MSSTTEVHLDMEKGEAQANAAPVTGGAAPQDKESSGAPPSAAATAPIAKPATLPPSIDLPTGKKVLITAVLCLMTLALTFASSAYVRIL